MAPCRILVVDDDSDIRETVSEILQDAGYAVATAADGADALDWLRHNPFTEQDLILLDLMMPNVNGWEFLTRKHGEAALREIPVLLVTANADDAAIRLDKVVGKISKPFDLHRLLDSVRSVCPAPA
jgi:CheY-like chemotaxis protein